MGTPRFSTNLNILRSICSGHGDPARRAAATAAPRQFTEVVPTPHAYSSQWPVRTKRARARSCASVVTRKRPSLNRAVLSVGIPRFLDKSQHFTVHLFRPWRPGSVRGSDGGPRRFTAVVPTPYAYSGQWPVASEDEASACSELRLGCHPETPVIEPCHEQPVPVVSSVEAG